LDQFFQRHEPNCGEMPHLTTLKNPLKKFLEVDPKPDNFLKLISSSLSKDTFLVKCSSSFYLFTKNNFIKTWQQTAREQDWQG